MVSYRLRALFLAATLLWMAHGMEEYFTGFHHVDPIFQFVFAPLLTGDSHRAAFVTFQVMAWILLWLSFLLLQGRKWVLRLLCIPGLIMILEIHHLVHALAVQSYYSGVFTASLFPVAAFFYWKELLKEFRRRTSQ